MPQVKRSTVPTPAAPAKPANVQVRMGQAKPLPTALPLVPRKPTYNINRHPVLVTGLAGTGKTTLGTQEPNVLNLSFDPPNDTYEIIQEHVTTWPEMITWANLLEQHAITCKERGEPFPYTRVQIDGVGTMSRVCTQWTCLNKLGGVMDPQDVDYGKGSNVVNQVFTEVIDRLLALPCGVWFIAHEKTKKIKLAGGGEIERVSPDIRGAMEGIVTGRCHMVVNIGFAPGGSKARVARIRGDDFYTAKCNISGRFLTTDGRQVEEIFLDKQGPEKAWANFMRAFNNGQRWANVEEMIALSKGGAKKPAPPPAADEPPMENEPELS